MKTLSGVSQLRGAEILSSIVTIGNFDGVHLGHRRLIEQVVKRAQSHSVASVVFTFNPHPVQILHPERKLARLFDMEDQKVQLEALGIKYLIVEPFSLKFSQLNAEIFLRDWILKPLNPKVLVVGHDFTFGAGRLGTIDFLRKQCAASDVVVEVVPPVSLEGQMVSSSRIRQSLAAGEVEQAAKLLGRLFYVTGPVIEGFKRASQLGVRTANILTPSETWPTTGVYATWATVDGKRWPSVTNIGVSPTFATQPTPPRIETHIMGGFSKDIYDAQLKVEFIYRIRDEKKFSSIEELKQQIQNDKIKAEEICHASMGERQ